MGNCVGGSKIKHKNKKYEETLIRVVTPDGGVMELQPPLTAEAITNEFSDHAVFIRRSCSSLPLHHEKLLPGNVHFLRPLSPAAGEDEPPETHTKPYKMFSSRKSQAAAAAVSVWKARLVISPGQLLEILAHDAQTEALIHRVRTAATCGSAYKYSTTDQDFDQKNVTSS